GYYAASLDRPLERTRVLGTNSRAWYAPPVDGRLGTLLWMRRQTLVAQTFDAARLRLEGDPVPVADDVAVATNAQGTPWSASFWSSAGVLAYHTGDSGFKGQLVWM